MTRTETVKLLAILRAAYPATRIEDPEAMAAAYTMGLQGATYEQGQRAVTACIEECRFFPTVAEIRERIEWTFAQEQERWLVKQGLSLANLAAPIAAIGEER